MSSILAFLFLVTSAAPPPDTAATELQAGARRILDIEGVEFAFRWIPPGEADLGEDPEDPCRRRHEKRRHVQISEGFWLSETEVTQQQWQAVWRPHPSYREDCVHCPVERVSWVDTQKFIASMNDRLSGAAARLPTSDEWEYAARAGSRGPYGILCRDYPGRFCDRPEFSKGEVGFFSWPDGHPSCVDKIGWHEGNTGSARPVGLTQPNDWGLMDMHGNVAEWCADPFRTDNHVLRGGSYRESFRELRSAAVGAEYSVAPVAGNGFRLALDDRFDSEENSTQGVQSIGSSP